MYVSENTQSNSIMSNTNTELVNKANDAFEIMLSKPQENNERDVSNDPRYVKEKTNEEIIANMEALFEDIKSVAKTGMTVEELEQLEKLLEQIQAELKKGNYDKEKVEDMMSYLEKQIMKFKKEVAGEAITEADDLEKGKGAKTSIDALDFEARIEKAQKDIKKLKDDIKEESPKQAYNGSELLQEIIGFQGK